MSKSYRLILEKGKEKLPSIILYKRPTEEQARQVMELYKYDSYTIEEWEQVDPINGGCWFCHRKDDKLRFDMEFDTFVHPECIREALATDPAHPEARVMAYLLEEG